MFVLEYGNLNEDLGSDIIDDEVEFSLKVGIVEMLLGMVSVV